MWIALGLLTLLLGWLMPPAFVERWYSRGLFLGVRYLFTALDSWWPFAAVYLLAAGLIVWLFWKVKLRSVLEFFAGFAWQGRGIFAKQNRPWHLRLLGVLHTLLAFVAAIVFLFQWLWGFNYGRVPLEQHLGFEPKPLTVNELRDELLAATTDVVFLRKQLKEGPDTIIAEQKLMPDAESAMRNSLTRQLWEMSYPTPGKVRGRTMFPKGILLRFSTAGVYLPFTGEGHVDAGLHHLQRPFVLAHEMSHAYGFGDEGTCNFLAYLACTRSGDPYLKYIGHLYYWRYVASEYLSMAPAEYEQFKQALPPGLRADVRAIQREMDKYPDILPELRDAAYNTYLQSQGIAEGMKNYDRVVMMVAAWRKSRLHSPD
ncbi:MAG: DUF3810 domain-containing protein [Saprospiraceae bacterium]|nr:DUF3810 domain-containing protein [Saprospiraceae bacterium]